MHCVSGRTSIPAETRSSVSRRKSFPATRSFRRSSEVRPMKADALPPLVFLGYRPRRPQPTTADWGLPDVRVASASNCMTDAVLPDEPDWTGMNTTLHYDTPEE